MAQCRIDSLFLNAGRAARSAVRIHPVLCWTTSKVGQVRTAVESSLDLSRLLEAVNLDARLSETICEVDLWYQSARPGYPLMVQFLAGHPTISRVIVHEDGQPFAVKLPGFGKVHGLEFERSGGISIAEPDTFGVPADQIPGVLNAVYTTGRIPQHLEFVEQIWD